MTRHLKLMAATHSDEPWRAVRHVDVDDPQLVDYAVGAGVMTGDVPYAAGDGEGFGSSDGDGSGHGNSNSSGLGDGFGDGDGVGYGDGHGHGDGYVNSHSIGDGDGCGNGDGDGYGNGYSAVRWSDWSSCPYYYEDDP